MANIVCSNVDKQYGAVDVIKDFNLDVADHEFIVFLGPSGCGKSTLLRMIAGLEDISGGIVSIGGRAVNDLPPRDRGVAMVFQNYALYPHMTIYDNIAFGLKRMKVPKAEIDTRIRAVSATLGLEPYLARKPTELSGGQQQRVAIARAMIKTPRVFLFDEPLSNLDAKLRVSMRGEIKRLQKRLGTTSLYVTHDQLEAMTLADRLVVLNGGRIEQIGRPLDVYHRPASTFVASFIGSPAMNLIKGVIEGGNLQIGLYRIALGDRAPVEGPVTVGLRAEDLKLAGVGEDAMLFQVDYVEELGAQRLVHGTIESQALTIALSPETPLSGDLAVTIAVDRLHFFSTETGKRLERGTSFANEAPVAAPRLETAS